MTGGNASGTAALPVPTSGAREPVPAPASPLLPSAFEKAALPEQWRQLLAGGQVFTALILSTAFSEKYRGRKMQAGDVADVRLPAAGAATRQWFPRLLHRAGHREAVAFTWLGDEAVGDRTIYVTFSPMRHRSQFLKIVGPGSSLVRVRLSGQVAGTQGPAPKDETIGDGEGCTGSILMSPYIRHKLEKVWSSYGLLEKLSRTAAEYPDHRVVFAGISHGATLAQAAALQFSLACPRAQVRAVTWNAFKWTDADGSALVGRVLGGNLCPFVLSRESRAGPRWDSVAGFPAGLAPMPYIVLLDMDTGGLLPREATAAFPGDSNPASLPDWQRAMELHFAAGAIKAMKRAMVEAFHGGPEAAG